MTRKTLQIVEVGPRDGLQNEPEVIATADKLELIKRLLEAGVKRIEVASFVHPKRVPQMADAEAVVAGLPDRSDVSYIGLVLNNRGLDRALATRDGNKRGVDEAGCVAVASNAFGQRNQGQDWRAALAENKAMLRRAKAQGLAAHVTISVAFGCPFEGEVPQSRVIDIALALAEDAPDEIALADTIGVAVPNQVRDMMAAIKERAPSVALRGHFHNTRGIGIANALAAMEAGASVLDSSLGGLGGCPFAPGATGNIASEELIYALNRSKLDCGIDLAKMIATVLWFEEILGRKLPSLVAHAGGFPNL